MAEADLKDENATPPDAQADAADGTAPQTAAGTESAGTVQADPEQASAEQAANGEQAEATPLDPLAQAQAQIESLAAELFQQKDAVLRQAAEFDNVKKRLRKNHEDSVKFAQEPLLRELVGVMDNLVRAVDAARQDDSGQVEALVTGMDMVIKQLEDTFTRFGLGAFSPKGEPFDPNRHEAVGVVETDDLPVDHVVEVYQTGYMLHDRVVRPAMVNVSKPVSAAGKEGG